MKEVAPDKETLIMRERGEDILKAPHIKIVDSEEPQELDKNTGIDISKLKEKINTNVKKEEDEQEVVLKDVKPSSKTKTIAIYSAKGGVGKTTISCELATQLALTSRGRGKLRVCIVDYNIDFGDVATTLGFNQSGVDLCTFGAKIDALVSENANEASMSLERYEELLINSLSSGNLPNNYCFTQTEIEAFLQKKEFTEDMQFY